MEKFKHTSVADQIRVFNLTKEQAEKKIKLYRKKLKKRKHGRKKYNQYSIVDQIRVFNLTEEQAIEKIKNLKLLTNPIGKTTKDYWIKKGMNEVDATLKAKSYKKSISTGHLTSNVEWQMKRFNLTKETATLKIKTAFKKRRNSFIKLKETDPERFRAIRPTDEAHWLRKGYSLDESKKKAIEYQENMRAVFQKNMQDPFFAQSHFNKTVKYKKFKLPSGEIINLQGYEPQVLTELLKFYKETDIISGVTNIFKEIGKITYSQNNKKHSYYPDFYIKSVNAIIEVKSQWTYNKWKEKNELKKQACLNAGFNFEFIIWNPKIRNETIISKCIQF